MCLTRKKNCSSWIGATVTSVKATTVALRGAARTVVDQRHFAENAFRPQSFEATVATPDLDVSTHDDKELVALFAFSEYRVSLRKKAVGTSGPTRRLKSTTLSDISPR